MALSVRQVLALPDVRRGRPLLLAGGDHVDRWAHVSGILSIAVLLRGDELILTTGIALPDNEQQLARYVDDLSRARAASLVINSAADLSSSPRYWLARLTGTDCRWLPFGARGALRAYHRGSP